MSDIIDQYEQQLAADAVLQDAAAAQVLADLKQHPCRGCPNLHLSTPLDAGHPDQHVGDGYVLARPYCTVFPDIGTHTDTGERFTVLRETWHKCPLFGITSIQAAFSSIYRRLDELDRGPRKRVAAEGAPAAAPEPPESASANALRWLRDAFKVLGLNWSADVDERTDETARLWARLTSPVIEVDDGTHVVECRRGSDTPEDARHQYWLTRWSQDHFEIHDDAWINQRAAPDAAD